MAHTSARMEEEGADGSGQETRGSGIRTWATSFQTIDKVRMHEELDTHHKGLGTHKQSTPRAGEGLPAGAARLGRAALQNHLFELVVDNDTAPSLVAWGASRGVCG